MCIAQAMKVEYWDEGGGSSLIIEEGTLATRCYVVLDGTVSIVATTGDEGWPQEKGEKDCHGVFRRRSAGKGSGRGARSKTISDTHTAPSWRKTKAGTAMV